MSKQTGTARHGYPEGNHDLKSTVHPIMCDPAKNTASVSRRSHVYHEDRDPIGIENLNTS